MHGEWGRYRDSAPTFAVARWSQFLQIWTAQTIPASAVPKQAMTMTMVAMVCMVALLLAWG
jgi:hypothetical protein